jgi:DNA-binding XRE family transcriptional regulator
LAWWSDFSAIVNHDDAALCLSILKKVWTMIRTEREHRASLAYRDSLREERERAVAVPGLDRLAREWVVGGIERALVAVELELAEYEELIAGKRAVTPLRTLDDIPTALVQARIAAGWTQRDLARRLGVSVQAVNRDELGGYTRATLARLGQVAAVLGIELEGAYRFPTKPTASELRASD